MSTAKNARPPSLVNTALCRARANLWIAARVPQLRKTMRLKTALSSFSALPSSVLEVVWKVVGVRESQVLLLNFVSGKRRYRMQSAARTAEA
eukprot:6193096-Pleurochrysis_carterae.AAC.1